MCVGWIVWVPSGCLNHPASFNPEYPRLTSSPKKHAGHETRWEGLTTYRIAPVSLHAGTGGESASLVPATCASTQTRTVFNLALSHTGCDPMISTLSNLGRISAASRDYTKYKEEPCSLHMGTVPLAPFFVSLALSLAPIQSVPVNNPKPKLLLWWNGDSSGLQSRLFSHSVGTMILSWHVPNLWMSQVVDDKVADELMLKNLGRTCFLPVPICRV